MSAAKKAAHSDAYYRRIYALFRPIFKVVAYFAYGVWVRHPKRYSEPVLILANHTSDMDFLVVAERGQQQAAVFEAGRGDGEGGPEMLVGAKLLVHPIARRTAPQCGEDHAEAERDQPVAFHDAEELLTSEKIRFVQPYRETLV